MNKKFETTLERHNIPKDIEVVDQPYSVFCICYETFKEFFVEEGYETKEKWDLYLQDFEGCDQDWIEEIATYYDLNWAYCDPDEDSGRCKGNDYFVLYE